MLRSRLGFGLLAGPWRGGVARPVPRRGGVGGRALCDRVADVELQERFLRSVPAAVLQAVPQNAEVIVVQHDVRCRVLLEEAHDVRDVFRVRVSLGAGEATGRQVELGQRARELEELEPVGGLSRQLRRRRGRGRERGGADDHGLVGGGLAKDVRGGRPFGAVELPRLHEGCPDGVTHRQGGVR